jgi:hypothetical protein
LQFGLKAGLVTKENALDYATLKMQPPCESSLFDKSAEDLCGRLLDKDHKKHLGRNGCQEIKDHPYYWRLNWESIISDRMSPPFIPEKDVNALPQSDIGTFSPEDGDNEISLEPSDDAIYKELNWMNQSTFDGEVIKCLMENDILQCANGVRQQIKKIRYCNKTTGGVNLKIIRIRQYSFIISANNEARASTILN